VSKDVCLELDTSEHLQWSPWKSG